MKRKNLALLLIGAGAIGSVIAFGKTIPEIIGMYQTRSEMIQLEKKDSSHKEKLFQSNMEGLRSSLLTGMGYAAVCLYMIKVGEFGLKTYKEEEI